MYRSSFSVGRWIETLRSSVSTFLPVGPETASFTFAAIPAVAAVETAAAAVFFRSNTATCFFMLAEENKSRKV